MESKLREIRERVLRNIEEAKASASLEQIRVSMLGKKGELTGILRQMGKLSAEERPVMGQQANLLRQEIENAIEKRRAELGRLTGADMTRDECGFMAVKVNKGKGGKDTLQRVLPEDERAVKDLFSGVGPTEKVFSRAEMSNHINIHGYRAEKAKRAYAYYSDRLNSEPGYRSQLISELRQRYTTACPGRDPDRWLKKTLTTETYMLRGENKDRAIKLGLPVVYDRLALLAVSVYDLSHWRLSVTVTNYMLA